VLPKLVDPAAELAGLELAAAVLAIPFVPVVELTDVEEPAFGLIAEPEVAGVVTVEPVVKLVALTGSGDGLVVTGAAGWTDPVVLLVAECVEVTELDGFVELPTWVVAVVVLAVAPAVTAEGVVPVVTVEPAARLLAPWDPTDELVEFVDAALAVLTGFVAFPELALAPAMPTVGPVEPEVGPAAPVEPVPAVLVMPLALLVEPVAPTGPIVLVETAVVLVVPAAEPAVLIEPVVEPEAVLVVPVDPDVGLVVPVVAAWGELVELVAPPVEAVVLVVVPDAAVELLVAVWLALVVPVVELLAFTFGVVVLVEPVVLAALAGLVQPGEVAVELLAAG
jgi:hypothetical protein